MTRTAYVLKVYPRFSETFIVTEILAREAHGDDLAVYALRPTTDTRFHAELARVKAPVSWIPVPRGIAEMWCTFADELADPDRAAAFGEILPILTTLPGHEVAQGVALAAALVRDGITRIHVHFASLAGRVAWIASKLTGIPYTITTHAKDIYHESVDREWLVRVCADAHRVIAISAFNEAHLRGLLADTGAEIVLQYNAIELSRFAYREPRAPGGTLRIAAVGRLVPKKGFPDLIEAVSRLTARGIDVEATLAGDGELMESLTALVAEKGLSDRIRLPGLQTQDQIQEILASSDVLVVPCVPAADGNVDGLPTVVLEAMAAGTPVIGTDVTGIPEVVINGRTGVLIEPGDVGALTDALAAIADGSLPVAELAAGARALIEERFDSSRQAARLIELERGIA